MHVRFLDLHAKFRGCDSTPFGFFKGNRRARIERVDRAGNLVLVGAGIGQCAY
jgi:hypothetical protein